jgi:DNA phosphorothioation-dependent restriction protein DptG
MDNSPQAKSMKTRVFQVYKEMFTFISNILCGEAAEISLVATVKEFREKGVTKKSNKSVSHVMIKTMSSAVKKKQ